MIRLWNRLAYIAMAVICFSRVIAYSQVFHPPHEPPGPFFLTDEGTFLWMYILFWGVAGVAAVWDAWRAKHGSAAPLFIGVCMVWGASYITAWIYANVDTFAWMTGLLYMGMAVVVLGFYRALVAADERIADLEDKELSRITAPVDEVKRGVE